MKRIRVCGEWLLCQNPPMQNYARRYSVWLLCLLWVVFAASSEATVVRAIGLRELVARSDAIVVVTPMRARSHYAHFGGARRVVTDTEVRIEQVVLARRQTLNRTATLTIRSSGGTLGDLVHFVYGEPMLVQGGRCLLFLRYGGDGRLRVSGRAQGEYSLSPRGGGGFTLRPSRGLDGVLNRERSASTVLAGRSLGEATELIHRARGASLSIEGVR